MIAKRIDLPYRSGERTDMQKIKRMRAADCVVGGFRYASKSRVIGSILLGLSDEDGLLQHVGFTSSFTDAERKALVPKLEKLISPPGFTGQAPGGPSRWSNARSAEWEPLKPRLVVEVQYDHFFGGRFRHGTKFLRWAAGQGSAPVHHGSGRAGGCVLAQAARSQAEGRKKRKGPEDPVPDP